MLIHHIQCYFADFREIHFTGDHRHRYILANGLDCPSEMARQLSVSY